VPPASSMLAVEQCAMYHYGNDNPGNSGVDHGILQCYFVDRNSGVPEMCTRAGLLAESPRCALIGQQRADTRKS
jgi:hypothetical protein